MKDYETNTNKYIIIYNQLTDFMRENLNTNKNVRYSELVRRMAKRNKVFETYKENLLLCGRIRNALDYNLHTRVINPIAEPHDDVLKFYQDFLNKILSNEEEKLITKDMKRIDIG
jgi:hypothetical protein